MDLRSGINKNKFQKRDDRINEIYLSVGKR